MEIDLKTTLQHKDCLFKYVRIETVDKKTHEGWMKALDPLTGNIVLMNFNEDSTDVQDTILVFGSACLSVALLRDPDEKVAEILKNLYCANKKQVAEKSDKRKNQLINGILEKRIPCKVLEDGVLLVMEDVTIKPPYFSENCFGPNVTMAERMRNYLDEFNENYVES